MPFLPSHSLCNHFILLTVMGAKKSEEPIHSRWYIASQLNGKQTLLFLKENVVGNKKKSALQLTMQFNDRI